jgi:hypothetical protein
LRAPAKYAVAGIGLVTAVSLVSWPFLDGPSRMGVLVAGAIALPIQIAAFALLLKYRGRLNGFLAVWAGGTLFRMLVVAIVAAVVIRTGVEGAVPMLLSLAGFFFALLLLEPVYFRAELGKTT